jgi:hypothetical protein
MRLPLESEQTSSRIDDLQPFFLILARVQATTFRAFGTLKFLQAVAEIADERLMPTL